jgi:transposase-like protein
MKHSHLRSESSEMSPPAHHAEPTEISLIGRRANAVKHGLAATTLLPAILRPGGVEIHYQRLCQEFCPESLTDELYLREVARHAARLELTEQAEDAAIRQGATALPLLLNSGEPDSDQVLIAATTTEALERVARYRRPHEKALHQAINAFLDSRRERARQAQQHGVSSDLFATEAACSAHLRARFRESTWGCPHCGTAHGHWLEGHDLWECSNCGRQVGLRHGTVFENSPLPLVKWFLAVRYLVADDKLKATELAKAISIPRPGTAQSMARRIREALGSKDAATRLAGLTALPLWRRELT